MTQGSARRSRITAVLARAPGLPYGDTRAGIELEVCLDGRGQLAPPASPDAPWRVRRFWPDREQWEGELVALENGWGLRATGSDDDPVWEVQFRGLNPGAYITLVRPNDAESVFRVVNVEGL